MDAAKIEEKILPSPLIERSIKFSGGPKAKLIDSSKKKSEAMKCEDQSIDVEEEVEEQREEDIEDHYEDLKD